MEDFFEDSVTDEELCAFCQLTEDTLCTLDTELYDEDLNDDILNEVYNEFERQQIAGGLQERYNNIDIVKRNVIRQNDRFRTRIVTYEIKLRDPQEVSLAEGIERMLTSLEEMIEVVMQTEQLDNRDYLGLEISGDDLDYPVVLPMRTNANVQERLSMFKDEISRIQQSKKDWILKSRVTVRVIVTHGFRGNGRMRQPKTLSEEKLRQLVDCGYLWAPTEMKSTAEDVISGLAKMTNVGEAVIKQKLKWRAGITWHEILTFLEDDPELKHPIVVLKNEKDGDRKVYMTQEWDNAYVFYLWVNRVFTVIRPERLYSNARHVTFCFRCGHGFRKNRQPPRTCNESGTVPGYKDGNKRAHYHVSGEMKQRKRSKVNCESKRNCLGSAIWTGLNQENRPDDVTLKDWYTTHDLIQYWNQPCGYQELNDFQRKLRKIVIIKVYDEIARCVVFNGGQLRGINPKGLPCIYLNYGSEHFEYISSMSGWLGTSYYCTQCEKGYYSKVKHRCTRPCLRCKSKDDHYSNRQPYDRECQVCHGQFWNETCFNQHRLVTRQMNNATYSTCQRYQRCPNCMVTVDLWQKDKKQLALLNNCHKCYFHICKFCKEVVNQKTHLCYIQAIPNETKEESFHYCFFDFETRCLEEHHKVNKVVTIKCCHACYKEEDLSKPCLEGQCGRKRLKIFNTIEEFCNWFIDDPLHPMYVFIAHNFKGYDSYPILEWLIGQAYRPSCIFEGAKIMQMTLNKITFKDSFCFIPVALRNFPKTFGLPQEDNKGWFPHFFSTLENQHYVGPYPSKESYGVEDMKENERQECEQWLKEKQEQHEVFDLQKELEKYCIQDVKLLMRGCLCFRSLYYCLFAVEAFRECITIAHLCLTVFKKNFLQPNTMAMVPTQGYRRRDIASVEALEWLCALQLDSPTLSLRTALDPEGEIWIDHAKVDGFDSDNGVVYQYHGCFWHGCETCFKDRLMKHPMENASMGDLYMKTCKRTQRLKALGYTVVEKWSHDWDVEREEYLPFLDRTVLEARYPILPRDALFGGRTNAIRLYAYTNEVLRQKEGVDPLILISDPAYRIRYIDVVSLYPTVMWDERFPLEHPQIYCGSCPELQKIHNVWDGTWFGLVKCTVVPPRKLYFPVLPQVFHSKLMFTLCRTCAEELNQTQDCHHTSDERCLLGIWTTPELTEAVKQGYKIVRVHEVWHYAKSSKDLFRDYIKENLRLKIQASGWPSENMTEEQQDEFIQQAYTDYGIQLQEEEMKHNPGLRSIAKLNLNCLWGKFGQNPFKAKTEYITDPAKYFQHLNDDTVETTNVLLFDEKEDIVQVQYKLMNEAVQDCANGNVVIAAFVTSWARLRLYQVLSKLNERVVYHDTDSVIYLTSDPEEEEIPTGSLLGMWSDECKSPETNWVQEFVSLGPKTYAYTTKQGEQVVKCKGISLTPQAKKLVHMSSMLELLRRDGESVRVNYDKKIVRDVKKKQLKTVSMEKQIRFVYNKRRLMEDGISTLPYGY